MQILSDYSKDVRSSKFKPGAYEWWYFDGTDRSGRYSFVVIFYEGNPFSTRYIQRMEHWNRSEDLYPEEHPAVSISIYENQQAIFYSFTEYEKNSCHFDSDTPALQVGDHTMRFRKEGERITYTLELDEHLPSGDAISGTLTFESTSNSGLDLQGKEEWENEQAGHLWNLVQPRAEVTANLVLNSRGEEPRRIRFNGSGYHDHNVGDEPMRNEFNEWYWGRFHFEMGTLVYYVMDRKQEKQHQAWLIAPDNRSVIATYPNVQLQDQSISLFGIKSARRIMLSNAKAHITVQQAHILDNGPFYQRFSSDSFINIPDRDVMQVAHGITEYIRPDRIYWKVFWPLMHMRIRYRNESPHWVQRFKRLYRWTW